VGALLSGSFVVSSLKVHRRLQIFLGTAAIAMGKRKQIRAENQLFVLKRSVLPDEHEHACERATELPNDSPTLPLGKIRNPKLEIRNKI
jgi:hypothetical protein